MDKNRAKTGGRKKGTPNKVTGDLREMVLGALDKAGGSAYLLRQAEDNPQSFLALIGKCLPKEVKADVQGGLTFTIATGVPRAGEK